MLVTRRKITKEDIENLDLTSYIASSGESDLDSEGESKEAMKNKYKVVFFFFFFSIIKSIIKSLTN